jgi:hypothetical protein
MRARLRKEMTAAFYKGVRLALALSPSEAVEPKIHSFDEVTNL